MGAVPVDSASEKKSSSEMSICTVIPNSSRSDQSVPMAAAAELTNQAVNESNTLTMINASIKSTDRLKERSSNQNVTVLNTDLEGIVSPQSQQSKEL